MVGGKQDPTCQIFAKTRIFLYFEDFCLILIDHFTSLCSNEHYLEMP